MARTSPAGPSAAARVGLDALALSKPKDALKEIRREIRKAEAELKRLAKRGEQVSAKHSKALAKLKVREDRVKEIMKRDATQAQRIQNATDVGQMFKSLAMAESVKKIIRGEIPNITNLVNFAVIAQTQIISAAQKFGGARFARLTSKALPFVPVFGEIATFGIEQWNQKKRLDKNMVDIGNAFRRGMITKTLEMDAQDTLTETWFGDPKQRADFIRSVAKELAKKPEAAIRSVIDRFEFDKVTAAGATPFGGGFARHEKFKVPKDEFMAKFSEQLDRIRNRVGGALNQAQRNEAMEITITEIFKRGRFPKEMEERFREMLLEEAPSQQKMEQNHRLKFQEDNHKRMADLRARAQFIPARLDY